MTPVELQYDQMLTLLRGYWSVRELYERMNPQATFVREQLENARLQRNPMFETMLKRQPALQAMNRYVSAHKRAIRERNPSIDAILRLWGYVDTSLTPQAEQIYQQVNLGAAEGERSALELLGIEAER